MSRRAVAGLVFYLGGSLALLAIVTGAHRHVLPGGLATQIGHNSEAVCFALLVAALVQFVRPRVLGLARPWPATLALGAALVASGWLLLESGLNPSLVTLNEAVIGAGLVWVYSMFPRPFRFAPLAALLVLAVIVVFFRTAVVLDQAESLVPLLLAPLALDLADRTVLEPETPDRRVLRLLWMGVLLVTVLGFMAAAPWAREDLSGPLRLGIDYGQRAAEAFWGWILIHGYFGYLLPPALRRPSARDRTSSDGVRV